MFDKIFQTKMHAFLHSDCYCTILKTASNNGLVKFKTSSKNRGFDLMIHSYIIIYTFYDRILLSFKRTCGRTVIVYYYLFNLLAFLEFDFEDDHWWFYKNEILTGTKEKIN